MISSANRHCWSPLEPFTSGFSCSLNIDGQAQSRMCLHEVGKRLVEVYLAVEHLYPFGEGDCLTRQTSVVLPKGKIFSFNQRGAHLIQIQRFLSSEDDSFVHCYHASFFPNLHQLGVAQLWGRNFKRPWRSPSSTGARALLQTVESSEKSFNVRIPTITNKEWKNNTQTPFGLGHQRMSVIFFVSPHMRGQYQTMLWCIAQPEPKLTRLLFQSFSRFFCTKVQSSSNSTLVTFRSRNNKFSTSSLCLAARRNQASIVSGFTSRTSAMPLTLNPFSKSLRARSTLSSGVRRSKKTVPVLSLKTVLQFLQMNFLSLPLWLAYVPFDTMLPASVLPYRSHWRLGQNTSLYAGAFPRLPILSLLFFWLTQYRRWGR